MARGAADRGLPRELPVMASLVESGLRNLRGPTYFGFFGMHRSLNSGEYRGFPRNPTLQVKWFLDSADQVRQRRVAEGRGDPAKDPCLVGHLDRRRGASGEPDPLSLPDPSRRGAHADRGHGAPPRRATT